MITQAVMIEGRQLGVGKWGIEASSTKRYLHMPNIELNAV